MVASSREAPSSTPDRQAPGRPMPSNAPPLSPGRKRGLAAAPPRRRSGPGEASTSALARHVLRQSIDAVAVRTRSAAAGAPPGRGLVRHLGRSADPCSVRIDELQDADIVREMLRAREYWRLKGPAVDLVILNEHARLVCAGSADRDRDPGTHPPVGGSSRLGAAAGRRVRPAQRPDRPQHAYPALCAGACRAARPPRRLADQLDRLRTPRGDAARALAQADPPARSQGGYAGGAVGSAILQWAGRLLARRPRVRDRARTGSIDARALDQCRLQCLIRLPGRGRGRRLHLVAEQPRQPTHPLVQRSGQRPPRRDSLCARSRNRRCLDSDSVADPP